MSVSVFTIEVMHSPMGSELADPAVDHCVDRNSRHPNRSLNWIEFNAWIEFCWIDVCRKYDSIINNFCLVVHDISKVKFVDL